MDRFKWQLDGGQFLMTYGVDMRVLDGNELVILNKLIELLRSKNDNLIGIKYLADSIHSAYKTTIRVLNSLKSKGFVEFKTVRKGYMTTTEFKIPDKTLDYCAGKFESYEEVCEHFNLKSKESQSNQSSNLVREEEPKSEINQEKQEKIKQKGTLVVQEEPKAIETVNEPKKEFNLMRDLFGIDDDEGPKQEPIKKVPVVEQLNNDPIEYFESLSQVLPECNSCKYLKVEWLSEKYVSNISKPGFIEYETAGNKIYISGSLNNYFNTLQLKTDKNTILRVQYHDNMFTWKIRATA